MRTFPAAVAASALVLGGMAGMALPAGASGLPNAASLDSVVSSTKADPSDCAIGGRKAVCTALGAFTAARAMDAARVELRNFIAARGLTCEPEATWVVNYRVDGENGYDGTATAIC